MWTYEIECNIIKLQTRKEVIRLLNNLITTKELAKKLDVTEVTIWRWRKDGMPFLKLNNSIRFEEDVVFEWLKKKGVSNG